MLCVVIDASNALILIAFFRGPKAVAMAANSLARVHVAHHAYHGSMPIYASAHPALVLRHRRVSFWSDRGKFRERRDLSIAA